MVNEPSVFEPLKFYCSFSFGALRARAPFLMVWVILVVLLTDLFNLNTDRYSHHSIFFFCYLVIFSSKLTFIFSH